MYKIKRQLKQPRWGSWGLY